MTAASGARLGGEVAGRPAARFVLTDRSGLRSDPAEPSGSDLGESRAPHDRFNLAAHVEDEAAAVVANRSALLAALAPSVRELAFMDQVHGTTVALVPPRDLGEIRAPGDGSHGTRQDHGVPVADALVTTTPGVALVVMVADCVPVVLADPVAGVVAVAHAGRRGVEGGVVPAVVAAMRELGARPADIAAVVGPAVCPDCYEVPAAMREEVAAVVPATAAVTGAGRPSLALRAGVLAQLDAEGVGTHEVVGGCTVEDPTLYSYRRDGVTGRFAMLAWLDAEPA